MFPVDKIRADFPMLQNKTMNKLPLIYFDNAATSFKPTCVIDAIVRYHTDLSFNANRGDYELSYVLDNEIEQVRADVATFIGAKAKEIVFTSGTSEAINLIAYGYAKHHLKAGDEILITEAEHASNVLPWYKVCEEKQTTIGFIDLTNEGYVTLENVKKAITSKTKMIAIAQVTNVLGYVVPIKEICAFARTKGIIVVVDGAQSVPHMAVDVTDLGCDFLCFSGHKMCGPTGIGVLYGRYDLLQSMEPFMMGGGMNARFDTCGNITFKNAPFKFEAGTQNMEGILGLGAAVKYLTQIGMAHIEAYEHELKAYAIDALSTIERVKVYNAHAGAGIITMNLEGVFPQDAANYFSNHGIAVRSGQHCAKMLMDFLQVSGTIRMSLYFYNTKAEVDKFVEACRVYKKGDELNEFF